MPLLGLASWLLGSRVGQAVAYAALGMVVAWLAWVRLRAGARADVKAEHKAAAAADTAARLGRVMAAIREAEGLRKLTRDERRRRLAEEFSR